MRYRIVMHGKGFITQSRFKYWPFWGNVFMPGFNYFQTVCEAESAIKRVMARATTDGIVVKELADGGAFIDPPWPPFDPGERDGSGPP